LELITRTVNRTPEVMVKVLSRGGQDFKAIGRHIDYLSRKGELEIETDEGQRLSGKGLEQVLLERWDLDLEELRSSSDLEPRARKSPPKLVHKLMFSMPAGTSPEKVLTAVKNFAREEFALQHRYLMVLHTDEPHPHVHMVVKAMGEDGRRLNIQKATLRTWRREFARHLRALSVPANATERAVRGETRTPKLDGLYRAELRGDSQRIRERAAEVAQELLRHEFRVEPGKARLQATRREVERGWWAVSDRLSAQGELAFAAQVGRFVANMPSPRTEREYIAAGLRTPVARTRETHDPYSR
jgi:hypothetical protein